MEENNTPETETEQPVATEATEEAAAPAAEAAPAVSGAAIRINGGLVQTGLNGEEIFKTWPAFKVGDTVKVHYRIVEGDKERIQVYEGNVISMRGEGLGKTMIVRRVSHEVGVERIFPYHSPSIAKLEVVRRGKVRRSKLFYIRHKSGKAGRIKEAVNTALLAGKKKKKAAPAKKA